MTKSKFVPFKKLRGMDRLNTSGIFNWSYQRGYREDLVPLPRFIQWLGIFALNLVVGIGGYLLLAWGILLVSTGSVNFGSILLIVIPGSFVVGKLFEK